MGFSRNGQGTLVRRPLLACSVAHLAGIYLTGVLCVPAAVLWLLGVLFLAMGAVCLSKRRSTLFCCCMLFLLLGHGRSAYVLRPIDRATASGVRIEGVIGRMLSDSRAYLEEVCIDGETVLSRPAVVTLMMKSEDEVPAVSVGQRVTGTGRLFEQETVRNPGGSNWHISARRDGYELSGYLVPGWSVSGEARFCLHEGFRQLRKSINSRIERLFSEEAPLFQAVMIGERDALDEETEQAMRLTGIAHLLTVSGMHMSLMAQALSFLIGQLRMGRQTGFALRALLLGGFVCLTGGAPGTVRAYIMAMLRALADHTGMRYDPLTALGAAALLMTLVNPVLALGASFQFSFFVVLGIHLLSGQMTSAIAGKRARGCRRRSASAVALSLCAQLAAMPMQLALYGYIPLLALPMNLISGLLLPVIMLGGWGAVLLSLLSAKAGAAAAACIGGSAALLERLSAAAASFPWGVARLPAPHMGTVLLAALLMAALSSQLYIARGRRRKLCALLGLMILLGYLPRLDGRTKYVQLDVGQGDAAVLRSGRRAVLVDVGPAETYDMLRYLRHEGLSVELAILSHLDEDHAGALGILLDSEIGVERIAMPIAAMDDDLSEVVTQALVHAHEQGIVLETYTRGDVIRTDAFCLDVLSPHDGLRGSNERSLALYTQADGMRILTLGDLPADSEMEQIPACDVLKVAHHGSRYATSRRLIEQAKPQAALISVGRNSYGHPTDRVLSDLMDAGADVYRTDQSGCLTVTANDGVCRVEAYITD